MTVHETLLTLLRCPACPDRPELRAQADTLVCTRCARAYPVVDGIPRLVAGENGETPAP